MSDFRLQPAERGNAAIGILLRWFAQTGESATLSQSPGVAEADGNGTIMAQCGFDPLFNIAHIQKNKRIISDVSVRLFDEAKDHAQPKAAALTDAFPALPLMQRSR
jgi:hypothetical protein